MYYFELIPIELFDILITKINDSNDVNNLLDSLTYTPLYDIYNTESKWVELFIIKFNEDNLLNITAKDYNLLTSFTLTERDYRFIDLTYSFKDYYLDILNNVYSETLIVGEYYKHLYDTIINTQLSLINYNHNLLDLYFIVSCLFPSFKQDIYQLMDFYPFKSYELMYWILLEFLIYSKTIDFSVSCNRGLTSKSHINLYNYIFKNEDTIGSIPFDDLNKFATRPDNKIILGTLLTFSIMNNIKVFDNVNYVNISKIVIHNDNIRTNDYSRNIGINTSLSLKKYFLTLGISESTLKTILIEYLNGSILSCPSGQVIKYHDIYLHKLIVKYLNQGYSGPLKNMFIKLFDDPDQIMDYETGRMILNTSHAIDDEKSIKILLHGILYGE